MWSGCGILGDNKMETLSALGIGVLCGIPVGLMLLLFLATRRNPVGKAGYTKDGWNQNY